MDSEQLGEHVRDDLRGEALPSMPDAGHGLDAPVASVLAHERCVGVVGQGEHCRVGAQQCDRAEYRGTISEDVVEQAEQCLYNIEAALAEAKCTVADVVRARCLLPEREDFELCWPVLRRHFGAVAGPSPTLRTGFSSPGEQILALRDKVLDRLR